MAMSDAAVRAEQVRTLYGQSLPVLLANVLNAGIVAATLWPSGPRRWLLVWVAAMVVMTAVRISLRRRYWRARPGEEEVGRWARYFVAGSMTAGLLWGAAGFAFFDTADGLSRILLSFAIGGMGAGAAGTLACYLPAFWAYLLPALAPLVVRTAMFADGLHLAMAAMMIVYGLGLSAVARITNRAISEAFRLRHEKEGLLERLSATQVSLEETNRTLEDRVSQGIARLEQQAEALQRAQRMETVGRLAGGVAHDFNNLLTVVLANVSFLLRAGALDAGPRTAVEEVQAAAFRGANLVRQLLAFSRRQRLAPRVIDLNALVRDMDRLLNRLVGETIQIKTTVTESAALVKADASQLEQVVVNLVTNARDAMPGGGTLSIEVSEVQADGDGKMPPGRYVMLAVTDTGTGMDAATLRNVFEPFFTTKEVGRGTGLGLATVYGVVEQSGGHICIDSRPGEGSRFEIYLPRTTEPLSEEPLGLMPEPVLLGGTVLLAEDEPEVRSVLERMLRLEGHQVLVAADGEQAIAVARAHRGPIDLLVTDVVMPHLGGGPLARALLRERPAMRVLFLSGYSWAKDLPSTDPGRGIDFLQKPFDPPELMRKVVALLCGPPAVDGVPRELDHPARK